MWRSPPTLPSRVPPEPASSSSTSVRRRRHGHRFGAPRRSPPSSPTPPARSPCRPRPRTVAAIVKAARSSPPSICHRSAVRLRSESRVPVKSPRALRRHALTGEIPFPLPSTSPVLVSCLSCRCVVCPRRPRTLVPSRSRLSLTSRVLPQLEPPPWILWMPLRRRSSPLTPTRDDHDCHLPLSMFMYAVHVCVHRFPVVCNPRHVIFT